MNPAIYADPTSAWFVLAVLAQTLMIFIVGMMFVRTRPTTGGVIFEGLTCMGYACIAGLIALAVGVPLWRNSPAGDAYDVAMMAYIAIAFARRGVRVEA